MEKNERKPPSGSSDTSYHLQRGEHAETALCVNAGYEAKLHQKVRRVGLQTLHSHEGSSTNEGRGRSQDRCATLHKAAGERDLALFRDGFLKGRGRQPENSAGNM